jgi:zinc protease
VGRTLKDIEEWPTRISAVTADDVKKVAAKYLDIRHSCTGTLIPVAPEAVPKAEGKRQPGSSRT